MSKNNSEQLHIVTNCLSNINIKHTRVVDALSEIKMLSQCFPNLKRVNILSNSISLDLRSEWEWTNASIKEIFIQNCSSVNFVELMLFVHSCLPSAADIYLIECNVKMTEDDMRKCALLRLRQRSQSPDWRNIRKLSFRSCSGILNIEHIILLTIGHYIFIHNLEILNCSVKFSDELSLSPCARFDSLHFENCNFSPECIHMALRRCSNVAIVRHGIQVRLFENNETVAQLSRLPVCMNPHGGNLLIGLEDFRNVMKWCPNVSTLGIYSPIEDFTSSAVKELRFNTAVKIMIFFWNNMWENTQLINFMSNCCPNLFLMIIHDCNISFDVPVTGSHRGIIMVSLRNCHGMRIRNITKFFKSTCPCVKFIDIQNCRSAFLSSKQDEPKITMPRLQRLSIMNTETPIDITQVFLSLNSVLGFIPELLIKNSNITFSPNTAIDGDIIVENVSCINCNFATNVIVYMKRYCRILNPALSVT